MSSGRVPVARSNESWISSASERTVRGVPEPRLYVPGPSSGRAARQAAAIALQTESSETKSRHCVPEERSSSDPVTAPWRQRSFATSDQRSTEESSGAPTEFVRRSTSNS